MLLSLCALLPLFAIAQKADSLKEVLKSAQGVDKYEALYGLAYEYSDVNDSLSLTYASQAFDFAMKLGDSMLIVKAGRIKAGEQRRTERLDLAVETAGYVLRIARRLGNKAEMKLLLNSLANSYFLKAEYDNALKYHYESLVIREAEGDMGEISIALSNIGVVYYKLRDYNRAVEYYKKSLELKRQVNDQFALDRLLINLGLALNSLGKFDEAKKFINDGLNVCGEKCSDEIILEGEIALGISLLETNSNDESLKHFEKSYSVARHINNYRFQAENLVYFARVHLNRENFEAALKYLSEAETISMQKGYKFLQEKIYELFSNLYEKTGDYKSMALYQSKYIALEKIIMSEKVVSNLAQIRSAYEERENIKTIAEKDQVLALQKEVIVRQQRQFVFIIIITCLVAILAYALFYFNRRQRKSNQEISAAKNKIEDQNQKLADHNKQLEAEVTRRTSDLALSNKALQKLNDELDYFIYKSSHDIRGPLLTLKGMCNIALMDLKDPVAVDYFKKFDITTDKLNVILTRLQTVNYITHSTLKPVKIDFKRIIEEIIDFEKKKGVPGNLSFTYELENDCAIISDEFLVRTIMENMIDNAVKFRSSSSRVNPFVKIRVRLEEKMLKIIVEDNGIGIGKEYAHDMFKMFVRASEQSEIGGVGLYLIKLAIDQAGGEISLLESSSSGSTFQALLPIDINEVISERTKSEKKLVEILEKQS